MTQSVGYVSAHSGHLPGGEITHKNDSRLAVFESMIVQTSRERWDMSVQLKANHFF